MPFRSQAQRKAMFAARDGRSTIGIPQDVAAKFIADSAGEPKRKLPERVSQKPKPRRRMFGSLA